MFAIFLLADIAISYQILFGLSAGPEDNLGAGLPIFTIIVIVLFLFFMRKLVGRDIVSIHDGCLTLRREILGIGFAHHRYRLGDVRRLRFQPEKQYGESRIAFDCGSDTIALGAGIGEREANQLIAAIKRCCAINGINAKQTPSGLGQYALGGSEAAAFDLIWASPPPRPVHFRDAVDFILTRILAIAVSCIFLWLISRNLPNSRWGVFDVIVLLTLGFFGFAICLILYEHVAVPIRNKRLVRSGQPVIGQITEKRMRGGKHGVTAFIGYKFSLGAPPRQFDNNQRVDGNYYNRLEVGDSVTVLYDPARPKRNVIYECCDFRVGGTVRVICPVHRRN